MIILHYCTISISISWCTLTLHMQSPPSHNIIKANRLSTKYGCESVGGGGIIPINQGRMSGDSSSSTFCTLGNMMHQSLAVRRREITAESSNNDNNRWDAYIHMPVIIPDDTTHGGGSGSEIYRHHDHDNIQDMDHNIPMMTSQGTIMFMDGFHSTLFPSFQASSSPPPCLNLFYPSWTLHTPSRFVLAMIMITLMGILVEVCGVWRVKCLRRGRIVEGRID